MAGGCSNPAARLILEAVCRLSPSVRSLEELRPMASNLWAFASLRSWLACSILNRCVAGLGTLASDCTEAFLGLACRIEIVLARQYKRRFLVFAGRRSSCPLQHRERSLGDRARARLASDGMQGQERGKSSQSNLQHWYGLLLAMAVSGRGWDGGAGCLHSMHALGRAVGWRAAALS